MCARTFSRWNFFGVLGLICVHAVLYCFHAATSSHVPWHNNDRASCSPNIIRVRLGPFIVRQLPWPMNFHILILFLVSTNWQHVRHAYMFALENDVHCINPLLVNHHENIFLCLVCANVPWLVASTPLDCRKLDIIFQFIIWFCIRSFWHIIIPSKVFHSIRPISTYGIWYNNDLSATLNTYIRSVKTQNRAPSRIQRKFRTANIDTVPTRFACHLIVPTANIGLCQQAGDDT